MKIIKGTAFWFFAVSLITIILSCGASQIKREGEREIVETSKNRPKWVVNPPKEEKGLMFAVGVRTKAADLDGANTDSRMTAIGKISDQVGMEFKRFYERARKEKGLPTGSGDIGWIVNDAISVMSQIMVSGVKEEDYYWEKYKEYNSTGGVGYFYDFWTLVSVTKEDFKRAANLAVEDVKKKASSQKNKEAEEVLELMRKEFSKPESQ
jgi:hypothetical protein